MDSQLALTRPTALTSAGPSKVTNKAVPAFLNKLYNMVDDPSTDSLIRWSDNGDSFLVLDQEHFAREVLGRWFKHQQFTSFVRQLNMYGFHKVPHLQQGVLRTDTNTEVISFENSHFKRGQPDLLCFIQRKKQISSSSGRPEFAITDGEGDMGELRAPSAGFPSLTGGVVDIKTILNGIASIRKHQTALSSDLKALQQSSQGLWQEALLARERHKKNEDTINRILKFLASVFGTTTRSPSPNAANSRRAEPVVPVRRARLMIEDGRTTTDSNLLKQPWDSLDPEAFDLPVAVESIDPSERFTVIEPSPLSFDSHSQTTLSPAPSTKVTPETPLTSTLEDSHNKLDERPDSNATSDSSLFSKPPPNATPLTTADVDSDNQVFSSPSQGNLNLFGPGQQLPDEIVQLLNNPDQLQRFLNNLPDDGTFNFDPDGLRDVSPAQISYTPLEDAIFPDPAFDLERLPNSSQLERVAESTQNLHSRVSEIDMNISELMNSMGLQPGQLDTSAASDLFGDDDLPTSTLDPEHSKFDFSSLLDVDDRSDHSEEERRDDLLRPGPSIDGSAALGLDKKRKTPPLDIGRETHNNKLPRKRRKSEENVAATDN